MDAGVGVTEVVVSSVVTVKEGGVRTLGCSALSGRISEHPVKEKMKKSKRNRAPVFLPAHILFSLEITSLKNINKVYYNIVI